MRSGKVKLFMSAEKKIIAKKINEWIEIADEDLTIAKHGFSISSGVPYRIIAFHSQQCAEKYLKAYLVFHKIDFPYTHNITTLLDLCGNIDPSFESLRKTEILTSYATANRYPGEYRKLKKKDGLQAVRYAEVTRKFVLKKLSTSDLKFSNKNNF